MAQTTMVSEFLPWLKVLNEYCNRDLVIEYNEYDSRRKIKLLEALRSFVITRYKELLSIFRMKIMSEHTSLSFNLSQEDINEKLSKFVLDAESPLIVRTDKALFKAIQHNESGKAYPVDFTEITTELASWGSSVLNQTAKQVHQLKLSQIVRGSYQTHDSAVIKESEWLNTDFSKLLRMSLAELKLFEISEGKFVEGVIITDPLVMNGITTFLEDAQGNHVQVAFYNMLPSDPKQKQAMARSKFKQGTVIRIAEPFYKIFRDGMRGCLLYTSPSPRDS